MIIHWEYENFGINEDETQWWICESSPQLCKRPFSGMLSNLLGCYKLTLGSSGVLHEFGSLWYYFEWWTLSSYYTILWLRIKNMRIWKQHWYLNMRNIHHGYLTCRPISGVLFWSCFHIVTLMLTTNCAIVESPICELFHHNDNENVSLDIHCHFLFDLHM